jgi:hypothetical protein
LLKNLIIANHQQAADEFGPLRDALPSPEEIAIGLSKNDKA